MDFLLLAHFYLFCPNSGPVCRSIIVLDLSGYSPAKSCIIVFFRRTQKFYQHWNESQILHHFLKKYSKPWN